MSVYVVLHPSAFPFLLSFQGTNVCLVFLYLNQLLPRSYKMAGSSMHSVTPHFLALASVREMHVSQAILLL